LRSLQVQVRQALRGEHEQFRTRYWSLPDALNTFGSRLGPSHFEIDGFFVQARYEDRAMLSPGNRIIVEISRALKGASRFMPLLKSFADNVFIISNLSASPVRRPSL
jgi:hypothetical protein